MSIYKEFQGSNDFKTLTKRITFYLTSVKDYENNCEFDYPFRLGSGLLWVERDFRNKEPLGPGQ